MDAIETLEGVLAKTAKNMSNENRKRAVGALLVLFDMNNNAKQAARYLTKFHYSVSQAFFAEISLSASDESIAAMAEALVNDEQFTKGNPNNIMYPKGLSAVLALAYQDKHQASFLIFNRILAHSEKPNGFSDSFVNNFKKLIIDKSGMPFILNLLEQATNGGVECKEFEQKRLARFLQLLEEKVEVASREEVAVTLPKLTQPPISAPIPLSLTLDASEQKQEKAWNGAEAIAKIEKNQQEILTVMRGFANSQSKFEVLSSEITRRNEEISAIKSDLIKQEHRAMSLASEIVTKERQLAEMKGQIDDLTERLRTSLHMDEISKNQELNTLKINISEALKLDYDDFIKSKEKQFDEDLFTAYRSTLNRIFKLLKRFGITCQ